MKAKEYIISQIDDIISKMNILQLEALLQAVRKFAESTKLK